MIHFKYNIWTVHLRLLPFKGYFMGPHENNTQLHFTRNIDSNPWNLVPNYLLVSMKFEPLKVTKLTKFDISKQLTAKSKQIKMHRD